MRREKGEKKYEKSKQMNKQHFFYQNVLGKQKNNVFFLNFEIHFTSTKIKQKLHGDDDDTLRVYPMFVRLHIFHFLNPHTFGYCIIFFTSLNEKYSILLMALNTHDAVRANAIFYSPHNFLFICLIPSAFF